VAHESTSPSLLDRIRTLGDQDSWRQFESRYRELILRYALARGLQLADAEDVRQAAMLSLVKALEGFEYRPDVGRFRDYLGTIVRNAVFKHRRRQETHPERLSSDDVEQVPAEENDAWNEEWRTHHYRMAMERLRTTFHPASIAVFEDLLTGVKAEDVARKHALSPEAVYKVKQRVRERLRELITEQLDEEEFSERRG
jgi:RNA polymerase sigma factor (sigma-70 family)